METIGAAEEGLKLATAKAEESKQGVDQLEAIASLAEAAQTKIIKENEIKAAIPDKEMQEAINGTIDTEHINILTPDEKWGSNWTPTMRRPGKTCLQIKNVIKRRTLQTIRNPRNLAKVKRIRKEKRVQEASAPATLNLC